MYTHMCTHTRIYNTIELLLLKYQNVKVVLVVVLCLLVV